MTPNRPLDVLLVHADSAQAAYQGLSETFSAVEPPTWCLLLAQSCRAKGFGAAILDCAAERLTLAQATRRVLDAKARLVCFVVYGQNPNSGTTNMIGATALCAQIKAVHPQARTCFVGSHTSALPLEVLSLSYVDFVLLNEGVYALHSLLATDLENHLDQVRGIGWKNGLPILNSPERVVPQDRMDLDLPGYAWDLLPCQSRPLDLYRAHFWHAGFDHSLRTPFAALYTSLGCRFRCDFCMVNILNRTDNSDQTTAAQSPGMRYWSNQFLVREFDRLAEMGVQTARLSDEMFFLDRGHYDPLLQQLAERNHAFRLWSYARVDTVRPQALDLFRRAGMSWLALGVEAASQHVRHEVSKGSFQEINIREIVRQIRDSGIHVISNYIFGFPEDTLETMHQTLDLAQELNTEMANFYPCMALPGSPLHLTARQQGWALPESYAGYAFLSYDALPLPTRHLSAAQVLQFRDQAWQTYFRHPAYLHLIERCFGSEQRRNVEAMARIPLRRRLLGDSP
jgi:anaerobic magnesium-protoporphyrin IX monomethyl ester cyclase